MAQMKKMGTPKMQQPGHYRAPRIKGPGTFNTPRRGRVGKMMPTFKATSSMPRKVSRGR